MWAENLDATDVWGSAGIIVKDDLTPEAPFYLAFVRTDYNGYLATRSVPDSPWESANLPFDAQYGAIEIVRQANDFSINYIDDATGELMEYDSRSLEFEDPVYVGLQVRSWNPGKYTIGYFVDVDLETTSSVEHWYLY